MRNLEIAELREYVFCLFGGKETDPNCVDPDSLEFLGTAYFVTRKGDAITANHVIAQPNPDSSTFVYGIWMQGKDTKIYKLNAAAIFPEADFALLRFDVETSSYLPLSFKEPNFGDDIIAFGYPAHSLHGKQRELRMLKGHLTMPVSRGTAEVSFPIPSGMSGGPVLKGTECVGFMMGNMSSERLLEKSEEITEVYNNVEKITFVESKEIHHYGMFRPLSIFADVKTEIFEGRCLKDFLSERNMP